MQRRLSIVLCLLAFVVQLAGPVVHMWEVSVQQAGVAFAVLPFPPIFGKPHSLAIRATLREYPQRFPHDAKLCPICQALTHIRDGMITHVGITWVPLLSWLVFCFVFRPGQLCRYARAARAPPLFPRKYAAVRSQLVTSTYGMMAS